jgi:hypothetical protein
VAARTYAYRSRAPSQPYDVVATPADQVYGPIDVQDARASAAVAASTRVIMRYGGRPIWAFFSASSGGRTSSVSAAFGGSDLPYLTPVADRYDGAGGANPYHDWPQQSGGAATTFSAAQLRSLLDLRSTWFRLRQVTLTAPASTRAGTPIVLAGRVWPRPRAAVPIEFRYEGETGWRGRPSPPRRPRTGPSPSRCVRSGRSATASSYGAPPHPWSA